ncbi:MAG TPA: glycosyltransferase family 4 protein [Mycobacteriales bacterium]|nr:glycosyltransferase family 4 protein [Mycobacteriales bacterium]
MPAQPLFVTRKFPPSVGGMETLAAGVWRALNGAAPGARLVAHGGSNRQLPRWLPAAVARVVWLVARRRCDVVLTGDALMYAVLYPILRIARVRSATMVMGLDLTYQNRAYRAVVHRALRRAPCVIAISAATAEVAGSFGVRPDRVRVVRLGVAAPPVTAEDRVSAAEDLRRRYGLPDDAVVLLTLGRLVRRKGGAWFARHVLAGLPDGVHYLVAGDGPEREPIAAAAAAAGVDQRVHLLGRVDDDTRERLLCGADIFVQPNIRVPGDMEGFGLVTIEAAMRGTVTVASGIEGICDAVRDGQTGILLPAEDPDAWIARLRELVADPPSRRDTGARFGARTRELYGERAMGARLVAELDGLNEPDGHGGPG